MFAGFYFPTLFDMFPWLGLWAFWFPAILVGMVLAMLVYLWRHRHDAEP